MLSLEPLAGEIYPDLVSNKKLCVYTWKIEETIILSLDRSRHLAVWHFWYWSATGTIALPNIRNDY
jgi:hypothetical protein